jgi:hypothetical protein
VTAVQNFTVYKNADWELGVRWENDGTPYILSDAEMQARKEDGNSLLFSASVDGGEITLDAVDGWATIVVPEETLSAITHEGVAVYDIKVTRDSDSRTKILLSGNLIFRNGVTQ